VLRIGVGARRAGKERFRRNIEILLGVATPPERMQRRRDDRLFSRRALSFESARDKKPPGSAVQDWYEESELEDTDGVDLDLGLALVRALAG